MSNQGPDFVPGPRCGGSSPFAGAYQFPALAAAGGQVIDLSTWKRGFVRITWIPAAATDLLEYGFFPDTTSAASGFDPTTDSTGSPPTIVLTAPDFLAAGYVDVGILPDYPVLRVEPSAGSGRCQVRSSAIGPQM